MKAMVLRRTANLAQHRAPLEYCEIPAPTAKEGEVRLRVLTCGVCHTELDEIEGRTPPPRFPVVPGHQIVGLVDQRGPGTGRFAIGDRVGVAWIHSACRTCAFCSSERENLCGSFKATGRDVNGGYAQFVTVPEAFAYPIPARFTDVQAAPLLCAGAIGYRSVRLVELQGKQTLGLFGFGASAHLVLKMVCYRYPQIRVAVFARNPRERQFALELGAVWSGDIGARPPELLEGIIDTTPVWQPVVNALKCLKPAGRLVINAIRKEEGDKQALRDLKYSEHLWMEKEIKSVANVTRHDVHEFLKLADAMALQSVTQTYRLENANEALMELKEGRIRGAKVLRVDESAT